MPVAFHFLSAFGSKILTWVTDIFRSEPCRSSRASEPEPMPQDLQSRDVPVPVSAVHAAAISVPHRATSGRFWLPCSALQHAGPLDRTREHPREWRPWSGAKGDMRSKQNSPNSPNSGSEKCSQGTVRVDMQDLQSHLQQIEQGMQACGGCKHHSYFFWSFREPSPSVPRFPPPPPERSAEQSSPGGPDCGGEPPVHGRHWRFWGASHVGGGLDGRHADTQAGRPSGRNVGLPQGKS